MAVVALTTDVTRFEDSESITGWSSIGGGAGPAAENPLAYVGTNVVNRKVASAAGRGFQYDKASDGGGTVDMSTTGPLGSRHLMCKILVTDYAGLAAADGLEVRIGTSSTAYDAYIVSGTASPVSRLTTYRQKGGYLTVPISVNTAGYRDLVSGSPNRAAVDYFAAFARHTVGTSKSENLALEALDFGTGIYLVGGDGADTDGTFTDFSTFDQGNTANRWGFAEIDEGIVFAFGTLAIGQNSSGTSVATEFTDPTSVIVFPDGMFEAGFSRTLVDLGNAGTSVIIGATIIGRGNQTILDTRPDFVVEGTAGSLDLSASLANHRNVIFTSGVTANQLIATCADLTQGGAQIINSTITTTSAAGVATIDDADLTILTDTAFVQGSTGHAIEITTPGTYSITGITATGYGADGTTGAFLYNNSGGLVTLVPTDTSGVTIRNGAGATTEVQAGTVPLRVTAVDTEGNPVEGARVLLLAAAGGPEPEGTVLLAGVTNSVGLIEDPAYSFTANQPVTGRVRKASTPPLFRTSALGGSINSAGYDQTAFMLRDD